MNTSYSATGSSANGHLVVDSIDKAFGATVAVHDASFTVPRGHTLALLGPSGCGKTTLLRVIAGLEVPDGGAVRLGERDLVADDVFVRPEKRRIGMVFQGGALFPHMTVEQNVAYGLARRPDRAERVAEALAMVDLEGYADRMPDSLSGGQAQRVALARAMAPRPEVLLLDEPFASLDAELRVRVRSEVAALLRDLETTAVFVTHDQEEAFVVGDRVVVMRDGTVVQAGTPGEVYDRPANPWVARFVGEANLIPGRAEGVIAETMLGSIPLVEERQGPCLVVVRPEHIDLQHGSTGTVQSVEFYGHDTAYRVHYGAGELTARAMSAPRLEPGDAVRAAYVGPPAVAFADESIPAVSAAVTQPYD